MLDSGASVSAIPLHVFRKKFNNFDLNESELTLQIRFKNKIPSILGRDFLQHFGIFSFAEVNSVRTERSLSIDAILEKHSIVFDTVMGKFKHKQVRLSISDNARPIVCKPRQVPHAFKAQVESELERLERLGVITPTETSDWGTPLVPILKADGNIRICTDYKVTVNRYLLTKFLIHFNSFSKLDLESAYNQFELDEASRKLVAWSTHKGVYLVNRLPFG